MNTFSILGKEIHLIEGDITKVEADVIVNAANSSLMGGGGVDGAIHKIGGSEILLECKQYRSENPPLPTGQAIITSAGKLSAKKVIHTVGPIWRGGRSGEEGLLGNAYRNSLALANSKGYHSIAFPSISTGIYGYPINKAVQVVKKVIQEVTVELTEITEIKFVLFSSTDYKIYQNTFSKLDESE